MSSLFVRSYDAAICCGEGERRAEGVACSSLLFSFSMGICKSIVEVAVELGLGYCRTAPPTPFPFSKGLQTPWRLPAETECLASPLLHPLP